MSSLLIATGIIAAMFSIDYARYLRDLDNYRYVSRETLGVYIIGLLVTVIVFHMELEEFFTPNAAPELLLSGMLFILSMLASYGLTKQRVMVCTEMFRTERCLRPKYIVIKGLEILLLQLLFLVIALAVSREIDHALSAFLLFLTIVLIISIPRLLHVKRLWLCIFLIGYSFSAIIFYYCSTHLGLFWPATYIHSLLYFFIWLSLADPSPEFGENRG